MTEIEQIRKLCESKQIRFTDHAIKRANEREINIITDIVPALMNGEIIEEYPDDYPYKSYLVLGITLKDKPLHVVCAIANSELWIISEYFPNNIKWESDYKTRKRD